MRGVRLISRCSQAHRRGVTALLLAFAAASTFAVAGGSPAAGAGAQPIKIIYAQASAC